MPMASALWIASAYSAHLSWMDGIASAVDAVTIKALCLSQMPWNTTAQTS